MKIAVFSHHSFEESALLQANEVHGHDLQFILARLTKETAPLAAGFPCVSAFANDNLDAECLAVLKKAGVGLIALRTAGFNHVDLQAATRLDMLVVRVPEYSPYSVAEHAVALMLSLNRKLHKAFNRVRELNFCLDGLVGFDMHGKTVGIMGTGRIGSALAQILNGFGCRVLAYDSAPNKQLEASNTVQYVDREDIFKHSHIISLHVPLTKKTHHLIDQAALAMMRKGVMLINTSRGGLVDTKALISALKTGHIGSAGLDVYEEEAGVFFSDHSLDLLQDDILARLLTFPNVLITSHQGFLTQEALINIAQTTLENVSEYEKGMKPGNAVSPG